MGGTGNGTKLEQAQGTPLYGERNFMILTKTIMDLEFWTSTLIQAQTLPRQQEGPQGSGSTQKFRNYAPDLHPCLSREEESTARAVPAAPVDTNLQVISPA